MEAWEGLDIDEFDVMYSSKDAIPTQNSFPALQEIHKYLC